MNDTQNYDQLFLLELLVENFKVTDSALNALQFSQIRPSFCFSAKLGSLPCFELRYADDIDEGEFEALTAMKKWDCNRGKSCVFPMDPNTLARTIEYTPLILVLHGKTASDSPEITIGTTSVPLGDKMLHIVRNAVDWLSVSPTSEMIQDQFQLIGSDESVVGTVELTLRLTCLGNCVLTNFKISEDQKFHFQEEESSIAPKCKVCGPGRPIVREELVIPNEPDNLQPEPEQPTNSTATEKTERSSPVSNKYSVHSLVRDDCSTSAHKCKPTKVGSTPTYKPKRMRLRRKFHYCPGPVIRHSGAARHTTCTDVNPLVPAQHGWAWKTVAPAGLKQSDIEGWRPGYFQKSYLRSLKRKPVIKKLLASKIKQKERNQKTTPEEPPTLHLVRAAGKCELSYAPPGGEAPEHYTYLADSEDSDLEFGLTIPNQHTTPAPQLRHQAQQFWEEDFPIAKPMKTTSKTIKIKNVLRNNNVKKKKEKDGKVVESSKKKIEPVVKVKFEEIKPPTKTKTAKGHDKLKLPVTKKTPSGPQVRPWDNWIMKIKCKHSVSQSESIQSKNLKNFRVNK